jgi:hypothetical protein
MRKGAPPAWNATAGRTLVSRSGFAFPPQPDRCSTRAPTHLAEVPFSFLGRAIGDCPALAAGEGASPATVSGTSFTGSGEGNLPSRPPALPALQATPFGLGFALGDACGRRGGSHVRTFEACSISSCAASRDRKIGAPRLAPKISLICWPNSPLTAGKGHHQKLAAGRPAAIFTAAMRSLGLRAAVSGGGTAAYRRSVAACPPAPHREPG